MPPETVTTATPVSPTVKVSIVEDQRHIRDSLSYLINGTSGFSCAGSYRTMEEALERIDHAKPEIVLCDIGLPGMDGIKGVRILKERYPQLLVLMLTVYEDDDRVFDAICAGATGYLLKKTQPAKLIESLREVLEGGSPMSPEIARRVVDLFREFRPEEREAYDLTPHEVRILKLFVKGHNYKTASSELGVSMVTMNIDAKFNKRLFRRGFALVVLMIVVVATTTRLQASQTGTCGTQSITIPFDDVLPGNPFFCAIAEAFFSGLTNGTTSTTYSPSAIVPREQMAAFVTRTLDQSLRRGSRRAALKQFWSPQGSFSVSQTSVGDAPYGVACDGTDLWVANQNDNTVSRVRASDERLLETWTGA